MSNLLIGGSGFIGSALGQALSTSGESVISLSRSQADIHDEIQQVILNLDTEAIPESLIQDSPDVYILTGQVGQTFDAIKEMANLERILQTLAKKNTHIFFFSTALVYGNCAKPATESTPTHSIGDYPSYKVAAERLAQNYLSPTNLTILRLGNVYGNPKNRGFVNFLLRSLLARSVTPITLSNNGQTTRDYIFIDDVVNAILTIKNSANRHGIINIVSGTSYSLSDIVAMIESLTGHTVPITHPTTPLIDKLLSIQTTNILLREHFGFSEFTPIESGLRQTLQRYKEELL